MSDGDFGSDSGGEDNGGSGGGAFDLNDNGTSLDEFVLLAAITERERTKRPSGGGQAKRFGCLLPAAHVALSLFVVLAL